MLSGYKSGIFFMLHLKSLWHEVTYVPCHLPLSGEAKQCLLWVLCKFLCSWKNKFSRVLRRYKNAVFKAMKIEVSRIHGAFWGRICSQGTHSTHWDAKRMVVKEFGEPGNSPYNGLRVHVPLNECCFRRVLADMASYAYHLVRSGATTVYL